MSEDKVDRTDKIPSGCPSPARLEKTDSSSSRQSGSPLHWDSESWNHTERIRPSSWDDSDDDLSPKPEISGSQASRIYSSESKEFKNSISAEINELKKQFFISLEKENSNTSDSLRLENLKEKLEVKFNCDRRQSPARVRRRSRSSSSSSPVPETQNSPEMKEKCTGPDIEFDDSDTMSPRTLGVDSSYYLNNFFSELRSKRISMRDSVPMMDKTGKEGVLISDSMKLEMLNELNAPELNDDGGYFCKTSRKLSQILEVEENRKDLEKSSEDSMEKSELFTRDIRKPELNDSSPPLQTARSKRSEKVVQNAGDGMQRKREGYKSLSFEEFGNFQKVGKPSRGSLSERSAQFFQSKIDDDFIHLCAKTGKIQLSSSKLTEDQDAEKSFQFLCLAGSPEASQNFWAEPTRRKEDTEKDSNVCDYLNVTAMPGSPTSKKSTNRSGQSHTSRTKSGRSRRSSNPQSPRFMLNIGGDSARSLRVDDVNTAHSQSKGEKSRSVSQSKRSSSEDCSARNGNKSSFRSEDTCESKTDKILHITLESPSLESVKSSRSLSDHRMTRNNLRSKLSTQRSQRTGKESNKDENVEHTPIKQNLTFENCRNSSGGSGRSIEKVKNTSCRSESSKKIRKSPRTVEDDFNNLASDPRTPRSHKIPELGLPLEVLGRPESKNASCRSPKATELEDGVKDTDNSASNTERPSDRNLGSRSRSGRFRKSTPRTKSATPGTSGSNSLRSKDSLENHQGKPRTFSSEEFESVYDALSNRSPVSAATGKSSCRETDTSSQQISCRSENSALRRTFTPKLDNSLKERPFGSRKSSMGSVDPWNKTSAGSPGNISPSKSEQNKSRPTSWTSGESKFTDVPPDVEKLDIDVRSGRTTNRSFIFEEYEEKEHRLDSSPGSRSEAESDRQSNKRLSIINEVTFEDLDNGTASIEHEGKDFWGTSRPPSRRNSKRVSPKSVREIPKDITIASAESFKGKPRRESASRKHPPDGGMWTELIQTFEGNQNSSLLSEKNFPGFLLQKEENSVKLSVYPPETETLEKLCDDGDVVNLEDSFELPRKAGTPKSKKKQILERASDQQREEDFSFDLAYKDSLLGKMEAEEERPLPSPQHLYYVDVDKGGPFGIGEFGDITWWSDVSQNLIPNVSFCDGKNGCGGNEVQDDCTFLFTSESVGEGHPDKMCDQISDAILDAHLQQDPDAKVACETVTKSSMILVSGEITSKAVVDYQKVVRQTIREIGYDDSSKGFDCSTCSVMLMIDEQSSNIAAGVHLNKTDEEIGAGDQGLMFGYATDETDECMPLTVVLAHRLNQKIAELRRNEEFWWARPDSKTQVTCEYRLDGGACIPKRVHTVVVSLQHSEKISLKDLKSQIQLKVIKDVVPERYIDSRTIFHINPCGVFLIGGPKGDAGLTGRKTIVDTYGGWGAHGGGSFSGKDFTKVDRSAAYACRWIAKSLVKAGLCRRCLIQVSYAIGIAEPLSVSLFDYGTSKLSTNKLMEIVNKNFDLRPGKIATNLKLKTPFYQKTSIYGHFGRCCFPWEQPKALIQ